MSELLVMWAQALDNSSPDQIELRGSRLREHETAPRQEAVSMVSAVVRNGARLYDDGGARLTEDGDRLVVEVPSAERDEAGREAPIVCCVSFGRSEALAGNELMLFVNGRLVEFSERIERRLRHDQLVLMSEAFSALKKKLKRRMLVRMAVVGSVTMAALALVAWLLSRGWL